MNLYQLTILLVLIIALNFIWGLAFKSQSPVAHSDPLDVESYNDLDINSTDNKETPKSVKYFLVFIVALPTLSGFWLINNWFNEYNNAKETETWAAYEGKMLDKRISQNTDPTVTGHQLSGRTYYPEVKYEFTYKGKIIEWDKIDYSNKPSSGDKGKSQIILDSLPGIGEPVKVYFSAEKRQAVLITGTTYTSYLGLIWGGGFFLLGLIGLRLVL